MAFIAFFVVSVSAILTADFEQDEREYIEAAIAQRAAEHAQAARTVETDAQLKAGCEIVACERIGAAKWTR